jgi:hypothetical protein
MRRLITFGLAALLCSQVHGQDQSVNAGQVPTGKDTIRFTTEEARQYMQRAVNDADLWRTGSDSVRKRLNRLLLFVDEPFDSVRMDLEKNNFSLIRVNKAGPRVVDSVRLRWINDTIFIIDPKGWNSELYLKKETKLVYPVDLSRLSLSDSVLDQNGMLDSTLFTPDTLVRTVIDTAALRSLGITLHRLKGGRIIPPLSDPEGNRIVRLSADRKNVEYLIPGNRWVAEENSPFHLLRNRLELDSLQSALTVLLDYVEQGDSTRLYISDLEGNKIPFWISSGSEVSYRLWVKNYNNDSITLWVGNPGYDELRLVLEDDVSFSRLNRADISYFSQFRKEPSRNLRETVELEPIPVYWDFNFSSDLSVSQTYLSNWTKGGESSFATLMDIKGGATYNNKAASTQWINVARMKFGTTRTPEKGFRKNNDEFSLDSKFNRNAWGKIGMSSSFYMKNQIARGYNYPNDSVIVSKFLNPGTITIGIGAEYKPFNKTSINLAPLSYKTTFVFDTVHIDQTAHGIDPGKKSKQEFGIQLVVESEVQPLEGLVISNQARFFSNYLNHPENIDGDWEVNVSKRIVWFFTISLNLHLIYDDEVRFTVFDENDMPVLTPDGSEKKVPKMQLKEFLGLTLSMKF